MNISDFQFKELWPNKIPKDWIEAIRFTNETYYPNDLLNKYIINIENHLLNEKLQDKIIYPKSSDIFRALELVPFNEVKVVIIGQDPYHGPNQANGLAFSVNRGIKIPPSLNNIYKELNKDLDITIPGHGDLESWAKQGVLLLNAVLTVEKGKPLSHVGIGWEKLTELIIRALDTKGNPIIFILWGKQAQSKSEYIQYNENLIIKSAHPSPLSANNGFFGSKPFSKVNSMLEYFGYPKIDWSIK